MISRAIEMNPSSWTKWTVNNKKKNAKKSILLFHRQRDFIVIYHVNVQSLDWFFVVQIDQQASQTVKNTIISSFWIWWIEKKKKKLKRHESKKKKAIVDGILSWMRTINDDSCQNIV